MNRWIATVAVAVAVVTAAGVAGCGSNAYDPHAEPAKLSSYATTTKYPSGSATDAAKDISYSVGGNGVITLTNASKASLGRFDLWINKTFVLQVNDVPALSRKTFAPELIYNNTGENLTTVKSEAMTLVELAQGGKLLTVAGPVKE